MSLRERFHDEDLPVREVPLPANRTAWDAAHAELQAATAAVNRALRGGPAAQDLLDRQAAAQAAVEQLPVHRWRVATLEADEWEALKSAHPPRPDAEHGWDFDPPTFYPAMLAETVSLDGQSDDAGWWAAPKGIGPAVRQFLINTALELNAQVSVVSDAVGKGWPQTPS